MLILDHYRGQSLVILQNFVDGVGQPLSGDHSLFLVEPVIENFLFETTVSNSDFKVRQISIISQILQNEQKLIELDFKEFRMKIDWGQLQNPEILP